MHVFQHFIQFCLQCRIVLAHADATGDIRISYIDDAEVRLVLLHKISGCRLGYDDGINTSDFQIHETRHIIRILLEFFEGITQLWFLVDGFQTGTALLRAYDFACQVRFSLDGRIGPYEENLRPVFIRPGKEDILFPFRCNRQAIPDGIDFLAVQFRFFAVPSLSV